MELVIIEDCCLKCAFHNENAKYGCEMADDLPVVCSVKMKKIQNEIREKKNEIKNKYNNERGSRDKGVYGKIQKSA